MFSKYPPTSPSNSPSKFPQIPPTFVPTFPRTAQCNLLEVAALEVPGAVQLPENLEQPAPLSALLRRCCCAAQVPVADTCPVCLDPIGTDNATSIVNFPGCKHPVHFQCALQCAWKGVVNCPTCRRLPIPTMDQLDVEDNQSQSIHEHNKAEKHKYFRKGLADASTKNATCKLKKAVAAY